MEPGMGRDSDPEDTGAGAVFRSSRRVNFVVRSGAPSRRFSSSRVSRDPMQSLSVDVEAAPPLRPMALGLEDDWSGAVAALAGAQDDWTPVTLIRIEDDKPLDARARVRGGVVYIAYDPDGGGGTAAQVIGIGRDLFALVRSQRAAIGVTIGLTNGARLVSFKSIADLFEPPKATPVEAVSLPDADLPEPEPPQALPPATEATGTNLVPQAAPEAPAPAETAMRDSALRIRALTSPRGFPDSVQDRLAQKLVELGPGIGSAMLFQVEYSDGNAEFLIGFSGTPEHRYDEIEAAVNQALSESRRDINLGITFMAADDPMLPRISRVGLTLG